MRRSVVIVVTILGILLAFGGCRSNPAQKDLEKEAVAAPAEGMQAAAAGTDAAGNADAAAKAEAVVGNSEAGAAEPNDTLVQKEGGDAINPEDSGRPDTKEKRDYKPVKRDPFAADMKSETMPPVHKDILRADMPWGYIQRSQLNWYKDIEIASEIPVFNEGLVHPKIQKAMQDVDSAFFAGIDSEWEIERERHNGDGANDDEEVYYHISECQIKEFNEKYTSVLFVRSWFMGGVFDIGYVGLTFDTKTGDVIKLADLYHKSKSEVTEMVKKGLKHHLDEVSVLGDDGTGDDSMIDWSTIDNYLNGHNDFKYYIEGNKVYVLFDKYEISIGAAGAFEVPLTEPLNK